jgi:outer membrane protein OmpA-like peptidoglycan-associated protein
MGDCCVDLIVEAALPCQHVLLVRFLGKVGFMRCDRLLAASGMVVLLASTLSAQTSSTQAASNSTDSRPAATTVFGDTGLWYVPTAEVLPKRRWSFSGYRTNWDREEAFSDVSNFRGTFAFGATDRIEVFGNVDLQRRIDADRRPVRAGGTSMDDPRLFQQWSTGPGDVRVGAKFNLVAPHRDLPVGVAVRTTLKLPTASEDEGLGTGKADFIVDGVVSGELGRLIELSGFGGVMVREDADDYDLSNGFRWGLGAAFPTRSWLRGTAELVGESYFDDVITAAGARNGAPASWVVEKPIDLILGLTFQHPNGFFVGYGASFGMGTSNRSDVPGATFTTRKSLDRWGNQVRIGWHPGVRDSATRLSARAQAEEDARAAAAAKAAADAAAAAKAAADAAAAAAKAAENRPPTVRAQCDPCVVEVGRPSTVTGDATDPNGDPLTYKWSGPAGAFANPAARQTPWTAPGTPGSVPVTVTVSDGRGGTASDTVTIQVVAPARKEYTFEDVHFDFDRYTLRPEATRILDEAVKAMQADSNLRLTVEGHTCNIGTTEYNLALGERRSNAVRDYLVSRGVSADRLNTVSYGEERPKHDNSREETRRLNRRGALTVRMQ